MVSVLVSYKVWSMYSVRVSCILCYIVHVGLCSVVIYSVIEHLVLWCPEAVI